MVEASRLGLPAERERIGIDTNPAVTSTVTLLELLVQPYRDQKEQLRNLLH